MKKLIAVLFLLLLPAVAGATSLYMSATGSDTTGDGTQSNPYRTSTKCFSLMSPGKNTLTVMNGTYSSGLTLDSTIVSGTSWANFLTIQAQSDGGVRVTASGAVNLSTSKTYYMFVRGIIFDGTYEKAVDGNNMYFYRCGFKGGPTSGNAMNVAIGTNNFGPPGASDISFEECFFIGYSTGAGRYQALIYNANNVLLRTCVLHQGSGWTTDGGSSNPSAEISIYNSTNVSLQNCAVIDGRTGQVPSTYQAQYYFVNNSGQPQQGNTVSIYGSMAMGGAGYGVYFDNGLAYSSVTINNFTIVDSSNAFALGYGGAVGLTLDGFTILRTSYTAAAGYAINYGSSGTKFIRNGIVKGWTNGLNGGIAPITYVDWNNSGSAPSVTGLVTYDPFTNGLQYYPRVEAASNLKTAGSGGGQMGAQIVNKTGYAFTRYGDPNFNVLTSTPLWPFPNESIIKQEFCAAYNWGFCDPTNNPTLTNYLNAYTTSPYSSSSSDGTSGSTQTVTYGVTNDTVTVSSPRLGTFIGLYSLYGSSQAYYNECAAAKSVGIGILSGNHDFWDVIEASSGAAYNFTSAPTGTGMSLDTLIRLTTGTAAGECASDILLEIPVGASWTPSYVATTTLNPYTNRQNARTRVVNNDMGLLYRYVYNVVSHYPARTIKAIDTAREPDNTNYFLGSNSTFPATSDYYHQIATASIAAKAADPNITVVCGHIAFPTGTALQILNSQAAYRAAYPTGGFYLSDLLSKGVTQYCDVWALDYFRGGEGGNTTLLQAISSMTSVLNNYGVSSPRIWVTEYAKEGTNFYVSTNTSNEEALKANYLYQDYSIAFSTGVEKIFYQTFSGLDYSLMDSNLNPFAVYNCLGNFYSFMNGYQFYQTLDSGNLIGRTWKNGSSTRYALWMNSGNSYYAFPGITYRGRIANIDGTVSPVSGSVLSLYPVTTSAFLADLIQSSSLFGGLKVSGIIVR